MKPSILAFVALAVSWYAEAATYSRTESLSGQSLLDAFSWQAFADPTHGRVDYVNKSTAEEYGLYSVSGNTLTLRADDRTVLSPSGPGRKSFRLQSNNTYTTHVAVFDISHMPEGCGTWPAVWFVFTLYIDCINTVHEVGQNWPNEGEIDILEGVNNKIPNQSTLHMSANCAMPSSRWMTGTSLLNNCDVSTTGNQGCGVHFSANDNSFGPNFNENGGGWYAVERTPTHVAVYFWERDCSAVPFEVMYPGNSVDPCTWGTPTAFFPSENCDFATHFGALNMIINLSFCGDWAGSVYSSSGCPSNCFDYVNNHPEAFANASFEFNSLNIYQ
ncbi:glycoside hydrolase family 16 protein [Boletus edulis]|nr:glycoside hydrolase family 16 protein [Boletus edulis]